MRRPDETDEIIYNEADKERQKPTKPANICRSRGNIGTKCPYKSGEWRHDSTYIGNYGLYVPSSVVVVVLVFFRTVVEMSDENIAPSEDII